MFILLRRIERWLHQHIFKVGWLITQNYQTTTIFYYTIFLPGVVLHEVIYWLAAGMLNVRAERAIKWPEAQEVGELKLNFVRINPKAHVLRKAIITIAPLLVGLLSIWYIAHNIFDITAVSRRMSSGDLRDVAAAFEMLLGAPLFWLWIYIIFTIANTMYPSIPKDLQGWRSVLLSLGAVALALLLLGLGGEIFEALQSPLSELIFVLQATFILMIAVDVLMVLVLGLIEYTIERTTGNSATFRGGKMITVTREEALEEQRKQREQALKEQAKKRNPAADTGLKSIYALAFSIPGIPPQEPVTLVREYKQASIEMPAVVVDEPEKAEEKRPTTTPLFGGIAANAPEEAKPLTDEQKAQRESIAARINIPERLGSKPAAPEEKKEDRPQTTTASDSAAQNPDEAVAEEKPVASFGGFTRPAPATPKPEDDESEAEEKPVASRFGGFSKPAVAAPKPEDSAEPDESAEEEKPVASRFGGFTRPAPATPKPEDSAESDESAAEEKPVASRFGGFSKPTVTSPKDDEGETEEAAEEKPVASRFGGFSKPAVATPKPEDSAEDEEAAEEKPVASRFGGFSKPTIATPKPEDSAEDEEAAEEKSVASRFGGFSKSASPSVTEDEAKEEAEEKPTTSRFSFNKPSSTESSPSTSRFGASPFKPAGEDADKDEKSASSTSRFASTEFRRIEANDEDEGEKKPTFGTSPFGTARPAPKPLGKEDEAEESEEDDEEISRPSSPLLGRQSAFGSPRPAPKLFGKSDEDEDEENEDDEEISRPSSPLLGRQSAFGSPRPAPKLFGKSDEDEDEDSDEEDESPRSRVSGFGLLGKRPKDDEIVYEDDEDDFRNFGDDDEDYVDSDDD